jgi:hypothetical protein
MFDYQSKIPILNLVILPFTQSLMSIRSTE